MKSRLTKKVMLATVATVLAGSAMAQSTEAPKVVSGTEVIPPFTGINGARTWSFGFFGGGTVPFGFPTGKGYYFDNFNAKTVDLIYGGFLKKQLSHTFGLQANFFRGVVKGKTTAGKDLVESSDRGGVTNPTDFKTSIDWAVDLSAVVNFGTINWFHGKSAFIPYATAGGGSIRFKTENEGALVPTEGGKSFRNEFYLPVGLGAKFVLSNTVNIDLNYKVNLVNANDFDGVSKAGATNGKSNDSRDQFSSLNLGLEFALGKKTKPQLIQHNPAYALAQDLWDKNSALKSELATEEAKHTADINTLQGQLDATKQALADSKIDTDGDGVADIFDKCPGTASGVKVDGAGCPLPEVKNTTTIIKQTITKEDKEIVADAVKNLEFDFAKSTIRDHSLESLNRLADVLKTKGFNLKLAGYTDNVGSVAANLKLSKERAQAVKDYLVSQGVDADHIIADGFGKSNPIASNKTEDGRQKNRRVEFTLF